MRDVEADFDKEDLGVGDRSARAAMAQIRAMGCSEYELGVRDVSRGLMMTRVWDESQVERGIGWLQHMNMKGAGCDIYVRPAGNTALVLVDDLDSAAVARMKADGLPPAVVVETSSGNYQVWVRLSLQPLSPTQVSDAARVLAWRYGGDPNSAAFRHYGRLAGFTNRKPSRRRPDGQHPYVLLREASGETAVETLEGFLATAMSDKATSPSQGPSDGSQGHFRASSPGPPGENYTRRVSLLLSRYPHADYSRLDWMVCRDIAASSLAVDQAYLEEALLEGSPQLAERKVGHVGDYVRRTAAKVLRDPLVIAKRGRLAQMTVGTEVHGGGMGL